MSTLFTPYRLGSLTLPNRIVMSPMTRARAAEGGMPTPSMATYYAQRASAGLIVTEGIQPSLQGQSNPNTPGLDRDEQIGAWRSVTDAVHANGGRIFAQLMHAGRVGHPAVVGFVPVAPSAVALQAEVYTGPQGALPAPFPQALSTAEVGQQVQVFVEAARRAIQAGFDGVELHGAHGYLIQQFLSSNVNLRTDTYGGSVEGRVRFAVEAVSAVAAAIGADRVGLRISPGAHIWGIEEEDVSGLYGTLLRTLAPLGLAYVHLGTTAGEPVLQELRRLWTGTLMVNPAHPEDVQAAGRAAGLYRLAEGADLVSFGRAFIANPDLVERLRRDLPLETADPATFYQGGDEGYLTYQTYRY